MQIFALLRATIRSLVHRTDKVTVWSSNPDIVLSDDRVGSHFNKPCTCPDIDSPLNVEVNDQSILRIFNWRSFREC